MRVTILLFAQLAEIVDARRAELELPEGATAGDAVAALCAAYPDVAPLRDRIALAVDDAYVGPETVLHAGAELALIPPVSGG